LPNGSKLPTANPFAESFWRNLPSSGRFFFTKLGPRIRLLPVPNFGVNNTLSIENAGGNNNTKCLYFPFCLDQAPLTWLESLEKYSIDEWDQLKEQFTSNFAGAM
jgi:hypothetical protein